MAKGKITLQMLSEMMANNSGRSKSSAELFVRTFFTVLKDALQSDNIVKVKGFGTFKLVVVSARESVNVNTGERVNIAGYNKITFTPDKTLKDRINRPFASFDTMVLEDDDLGIVSEAEDSDAVEAKEEPEVAQAEDTVIGEEAKVTPLMDGKVVEVDEKVKEEENAEAITEEKPVEEEKPATNVETPKTPHKSRALWVTVGVLLVVGLLIFVLFAVNSGKQEAAVAEVKTDTTADSIAISPVQKAEQDSLALLREAAKDYEQVESGDMLIAGTRTYRKITRSHNLVRYCMQIYGTKKVLPYVIKFNNLKSEYVPVGKVVKFPILIEKQNTNN